jgi:hypothetical protein
MAQLIRVCARARRREDCGIGQNDVHDQGHRRIRVKS